MGFPPSMTTMVYMMRPVASNTLPKASQTRQSVKSGRRDYILTLGFSEEVSSVYVDGQIENERD